MVARATAPNRVGPGSVFPDAAKWDFSSKELFFFFFVSSPKTFAGGLKGSPMASAPFWVAMSVCPSFLKDHANALDSRVCQIIIVIGYFWFYRKEQLCAFSISPWSTFLTLFLFSAAMIMFLLSFFLNSINRYQPRTSLPEPYSLASFTCFAFFSRTCGQQSSSLYFKDNVIALIITWVVLSEIENASLVKKLNIRNSRALAPTSYLANLF